MREFWANDNHYSSGSYWCPCVVNDDGTAVDDAKVFAPKISFFSQPDHGFGEKSVSHITVTDEHVYPSFGGEGNHHPMYWHDEWYEGWTKRQGLISTTLNTVYNCGWKGEGDDPFTSDWYIVIKHTKPNNTYKYYVEFTDREWWCSPSYAAEYGWTQGQTHGFDHSTMQMYLQIEEKHAFNRYALTADQAECIYLSVADQHAVPAGLVSELYRNAMNSITCNTNSIANIREVVELLKDIKSGNIGALVSDIPSLLKGKNIRKAASSSWLGYRYSYSTTKSDIAEYKDKLLPYLLDYNNGRHIVRSGISTSKGEAHCKVIYRDRALSAVEQVYTLLKRTGLALDLYNAWDMVPLSFVADWFLPIGDYLEDFSQNWVANTQIFDIATITTSWKWSHWIRDMRGGYRITYYSRSVTSDPPAFESYAEDPSSKTVLKRIVDAAALIVG